MFRHRSDSVVVYYTYSSFLSADVERVRLRLASLICIDFAKTITIIASHA